MAWVVKQPMPPTGGKMYRVGDVLDEDVPVHKNHHLALSGYIEWIDDERVGVKEASPKTLPIEPLGEIEPAPSIKPKKKKKGRILKRS